MKRNTLTLVKETPNNLATKNRKDFAVLENGDAYISQRAASRLCGVMQNSVVHFFKNKEDISQGLTPKQLYSVVRKYALDKISPRQEAIETLDLIAEAGAKAWMYHQAGFVMDAKPSSQPSPDKFLQPLTPHGKTNIMFTSKIQRLQDELEIKDMRISELESDIEYMKLPNEGENNDIQELIDMNNESLEKIQELQESLKKAKKAINVLI